MKAKITDGKYKGVEFEISSETEKSIERNLDNYADVKQYCKEHPIHGHCYFATFVELDVSLVRVPLPEANDIWTFDAFDWVKTFCKHFNSHSNHYCYPVHKERNDNTKYIWISVN